MQITKDYYSKLNQLQVKQDIIDKQAKVYFRLCRKAVKCGLAEQYGEKVTVLAYQDAPNTKTNWEHIAKEAEKAGLISQAYSGIIILAHPQEQIIKNHYHRIQIACNGEWRCERIEKE